MDVWMHVWVHECVSMYSYHILPTAIDIFRENHSSYATASLIAFSHIYMYIYIHKTLYVVNTSSFFPLHYSTIFNGTPVPTVKGTPNRSPTLMASGGYDSNVKTGTERPPTEVLFSPQKTTAWHKGLTVMDQKRVGGYFGSFKIWWVSFETWLGMVVFACAAVFLYCPHNTSSIVSHFQSENPKGRRKTTLR